MEQKSFWEEFKADLRESLRLGNLIGLFFKTLVIVGTTILTHEAKNKFFGNKKPNVVPFKKSM